MADEREVLHLVGSKLAIKYGTVHTANGHFVTNNGERLPDAELDSLREQAVHELAVQERKVEAINRILSVINIRNEELLIGILASLLDPSQKRQRSRYLTIMRWAQATMKSAYSGSAWPELEKMETQQ